MADLADHLRAIILAAVFFPLVTSIPSLAQAQLPSYCWLFSMAIFGPIFHLAILTLYKLSDKEPTDR
jgi:hypothetical protein